MHGRKPEIGDYYVYETELLGPIAHSEYDQAFFKSLDAQLNKVNEFYKRKEDEFIQRGAILDKQICALTGVKKLLEQGRIRQDGYGTSGRQSELGRCSHILTMMDLSKISYYKIQTCSGVKHLHIILTCEMTVNLSCFGVAQLYCSSIHPSDS